MNKEQHAKAVHHLTRWLKREGMIKAGQIVQVNIEVIEADSDPLAKAIAKMVWNRVRMANLIHIHDLTLVKIKSSSLETMLKYNGIGEGILHTFGQALKKEGIICPWMAEIGIR